TDVQAARYPSSGSLHLGKNAGSAGDLPRVRAAETHLARGRDRGVRVGFRPVDPREDDEVAGLEAREAPRVEDADLSQRARGPVGGGERGAPAVRPRVRDE